MVLRVNKDKGHIDLSKPRVSEEDIQGCEERYNKSKLVHSIMRHVAETINIDLEDLYVHVGWPLYRKYGHAFEIWYDNVPYPKLVEYKKDRNWMKKSGHYFVFPGGGTQFKDGVNHYVGFIEEIFPTIEWGKSIRVILDVGCGVSSFGGYLLDKNVITMSFAPKDEHEAQIQFALERGIPATLSVIATKKLAFPDNAFGMIHCARCRVHWHADGGKPLMELNRILRPGGYFIWSATPVYKKDEGHNCLERYTPWPQRLNTKPLSLSLETDAEEIFNEDTRHWAALVSDVYLGGLDINWSSVRNMMDMNAGYGGFATALIDRPLWVMNVVPISGPDTLPIIFDRGLIGTYHDWWECDLVDVAVEMDRVLRPGRYVLVQDTIQMIKQLGSILRSLHWSVTLHQEQFLVGKKDFWRPKDAARE
ncbi:hypothetical protein RND71_030617 [Anisodus tanguticus]|uniref:Methyltransferase n=1 Tax=Anisodus tanguticus TaxID=243964 RepID=A0AAE1RHI5_9SOLA|nr:hypothetical protein RND71_030617 [Anisodus tanguticus]